MRKASSEAGSRDRGTQAARRWRGVAAAFVFVTLVVVLAACQSSPPPEPTPAVQPEFDLELELANLDLAVDEAHRVRFLPPLAKKAPQGEFVTDLAIEIRTFNVNPTTRVASGTALGRTLSTAGRTIASSRGSYATIWLALDLILERRATQYVRLEIRTPGGPNAPVCGGTSEQCLGYLDVYLFKGLWLGRQTVPDGFVPLPALLGVLPMGFKVLAAQPAAGGPAPSSIEELVGLSGERLTGSVGNCATSALAEPRAGQGLQAVGAGLQAVGAVGGLFQGPTADLTAPLITAGTVGGELERQLSEGFYGENDSVLFIVDDFGAGVDLPAELSAPGADLAALAPRISHGALVLHHVLGLVATALRDRTGDGTRGLNSIGDYFVFGSGYGRLYIQVVDVGDMNTDDIPGKIVDAIDAYSDDGYRAFKMFVNMSFAVVPCSVLEDFRNASQLVTFDAYVAALAAVNRVEEGSVADLEELVSTPVKIGEDPLLEYLACPFPRADGLPACDGGIGDEYGPFERLVHVAASGNYGNGYALYPAAADHVVSVGALDGTEGGYQAADYSNAAQMAAPGGLFELATVAGRTIAYAGTSFAAPEVALFLAIDGMSAASVCAAHNVGPVEDLWLATKPLYSGTPVPFYSPDLGDWETALAQYCWTAG